MITIGKYTFMIVKKSDKKPVRLEKKESLDYEISAFNTKMNFILLILLLILFIILCFMVVPQTYGFYHW